MWIQIILTQPYITSEGLHRLLICWDQDTWNFIMVNTLGIGFIAFEACDIIVIPHTYDWNLLSVLRMSCLFLKYFIGMLQRYRNKRYRTHYNNAYDVNHSELANAFWITFWNPQWLRHCTYLVRQLLGTYFNSVRVLWGQSQVTIVETSQEVVISHAWMRLCSNNPKKSGNTCNARQLHRNSLHAELCCAQRKIYFSLNFNLCLKQRWSL